MPSSRIVRIDHADHLLIVLAAETEVSLVFLAIVVFLLTVTECECRKLLCQTRYHTITARAIVRHGVVRCASFTTQFGVGTLLFDFGEMPHAFCDTTVLVR